MSTLALILLFTVAFVAGLLIPKKNCWMVWRHRIASGLLGILVAFLALLLGLGLSPNHPVAAPWFWLVILIGFLSFGRRFCKPDEVYLETEAWRPRS